MLSFYGYMMKYTNSEDSTGALARYMSRQCDFVRSSSYDDNLDQLHRCGASEFLLETFDRVYEAHYMEYLKDQRRISEGLAIQYEIFDRTNCTHDAGEIRSQFKQRPELALLALIAKGLFEIADAIRAGK